MKKLIILLFIITTSCSSIFVNRALKRTGVFDTKSEIKVIEKKNNNTDKILFIGMHHIGRKEFYDDVKHKIDSLQKLNYTIFYEGVTNSKETDSLIVIKNFKKIRKLMGFFAENYLDTTTNMIAGKIKYRGTYKLINQPKPSKLNIDSLTSVKADVSLTELITEFEKNNTEIKLDSCDLRYNLKDKNYKCKKVKKSLRKIFKVEYIEGFRNKYLAESIVKSKKNKIVVIYGSSHFYGLYFELLSLDENYRLSKI